ncbi:hypothetical protein GW17_00037414 [Ensete ventricosum]|nr:hypothetical protein GW17_00037414 [Ensete ventricosum]
MGGCPYGKRRCPRAAPRRRSSIMPASGASMGSTPLRAGRGHCPYDLAASKRRPLLAGQGWALPLRPDRKRMLPLAGWLRATAFAGGPSRLRLPLQRVWPWLATLVEGLAMSARPLSSLRSL